jgi:uncharacterized protein (TIGR02646 family)
VKFVDRTIIPLPEDFHSDKHLEAKHKLKSFFNYGYKQSKFKFNSSIWLKTNEALKFLFEKKCAYCESHIGAVSDGVIDHFRPKGSVINLDGKQSDGYWWLAYEWENLYLSCEVCNRYKRNKFPIKGKRADNYQSLLEEKYLLVDPCKNSDVSEAAFHYELDGTMLTRSEKGLVTIDLLSLNRLELRERRKSLIGRLDSEFNLFIKESNSLTGVEVFGWSLIQKFAKEEYQSLIHYFINDWVSSYDVDNFVGSERTAESPLESNSLKESVELNKDNLKVINQEYPQDFYQKTRIIKNIEIKNFKSINALSLDFPKTSGDQESWVMIVGENGVGKSTILQAISLALAGQEYLNELDVEWRHFIRRHSGARKAEVKVYLSNLEDPIILTITKNGATLTPEKPQILVLGYGSTRLLPKERHKIEEGFIKTNIKNLFDNYSQLKNVESWLSDPKQVSSDDFNSISASIRELLMLPGFNDGKEILLRRRSGKITVNLGGTTQNIYELCDGYKSVLACVLDIMMSIHSLWPSPENAQGVVLLDEIETHLHPSWKIKIVSLLRNIFPLLNFVVTTHDPLCLRGAKKGEVIVLNFSDERELSKSVIDIPPGIPIEDLLMGVWFKMESTLDEDTVSLVKRHSQLVLNSKNDNVEERKQIESRLKERVGFTKASGLFGSYLEILEETLRESNKNLSKQQIADSIRNRLKQKTQGPS